MIKARGLSVSAGGPDHGAAVRAKGQRGDSAVVALQDAHTLAGAQVPQSDAAVQGGREELQAVGVGVELDQAADRGHFCSRILLQLYCTVHAVDIDRRYRYYIFFLSSFCS